MRHHFHRLAALFLSISMMACSSVRLGNDATEMPKTATNSIGIEFVLIPSGSFTMGDDSSREDEALAHQVTISRPFYLSKYTVTQAQWFAVMGAEYDLSIFKGQNNPAESVVREFAEEFIQRLNQKEGTDKYRLPSEAEWEYAARAGTTTPYFFGEDASHLEQYAWYGEERDSGSTHPVGQKLPNPWGLYDIYGNVMEWVQDQYEDDYYFRSPIADPTGPSRVEGNAVLRGGSWNDAAEDARSARRFSSRESGEALFGTAGFRLAFHAAPPLAKADENFAEEGFKSLIKKANAAIAHEEYDDAFKMYAAAFPALSKTIDTIKKEGRIRSSSTYEVDYLSKIASRNVFNISELWLDQGNYEGAFKAFDLIDPNADNLYEMREFISDAILNKTNSLDREGIYADAVALLEHYDQRYRSDPAMRKILVSVFIRKCAILMKWYKDSDAALRESKSEAALAEFDARFASPARVSVTERMELLWTLRKYAEALAFFDSLTFDNPETAQDDSRTAPDSFDDSEFDDAETERDGPKTALDFNLWATGAFTRHCADTRCAPEENAATLALIERIGRQEDKPTPQGQDFLELQDFLFESQSNQGKILARQGKYTDARARFETLLKQFGGNYYDLFSSITEAAESQIKNGNDEDDDNENGKRRSNKLPSDETLSGVLALYDLIITYADPKTSGISFHEALSPYKLKDLQDKKAKAILAKGKIFASQGRYDEALDLYGEIEQQNHEALKLKLEILVSPNILLNSRKWQTGKSARYAAAHTALAEAIRRVLNKKAIEKWEKEQALKEIWSLCHHTAEQLSKQKQYSEALKFFELEIKSFRTLNADEYKNAQFDIIWANSKKAELLEKLEKYSAAFNAYADALKVDPDGTSSDRLEMRISQVALLNLQSKTPKALRLLEQIEKNPEWGEPRAQVWELVSKAKHWADNGKYPAALQTYDFAIRHYGKTKTPEVLERVADAMLQRSGTLAEMGNIRGALASYDEVARRFAASEEIRASNCDPVARALFEKSRVFKRQGDLEGALASYDEFIRLSANADMSEYVPCNLVQALFDKDAVLQEMESSGATHPAAPPICEHILESNPSCGEVCFSAARIIPKATEYEGSKLAQYDAVEMCLKNKEGADELRAKALLEKSALFRLKKDYETAVQVLAQIEAIPVSTMNQNTRNEIGTALNSKMFIQFEHLNDSEGALRTAKTLRQRYADATDTDLREHYVRAQKNSIEPLIVLGRNAEAIQLIHEIRPLLATDEKTSDKAALSFLLWLAEPKTPFSEIRTPIEALKIPETACDMGWWHFHTTRAFAEKLPEPRKTQAVCFIDFFERHHNKRKLDSCLIPTGLSM